MGCKETTIAKFNLLRVLRGYRAAGQSQRPGYVLCLGELERGGILVKEFYSVKNFILFELANDMSGLISK